MSKILLMETSVVKLGESAAGMVWPYLQEKRRGENEVFDGGQI